MTSEICEPGYEAECPPEYWQAWFDGSAQPNPGVMGIGVVLLSPRAQRHERSARLAGCGCNNEAELHALCALLELASGLGVRYLRVSGDSDVAIRYVRGPDVTAVAPLAALVAKVRDRLNYFDDVVLQWIPRHKNGEADRLARRALGLPDKPAAIHQKKRKRCRR